MEAEIAILRNGPLHIELIRVLKPKQASIERSIPDTDIKTCGHKHIALSVEDARKFVSVLAQRGADVVWIRDLPQGRTAAFIRDNELNLIEIVQFSKIVNSSVLTLQTEPMDP
jgi:methylmalonyl-CoA/ethylmalonyl-CoA epimerase